jgi:hypothetical protein
LIGTITHMRKQRKYEKDRVIVLRGIAKRKRKGKRRRPQMHEDVANIRALAHNERSHVEVDWVWKTYPTLCRKSTPSCNSSQVVFYAS